MFIPSLASYFFPLVADVSREALEGDTTGSRPSLLSGSFPPRPPTDTLTISTSNMNSSSRTFGITNHTV
jgi:hypothetical protein